MADARQRGCGRVAIRAGDMAQQLWPGENRNQLVCAVMYDLIQNGDWFRDKPREGSART